MLGVSSLYSVYCPYLSSVKTITLMLSESQREQFAEMTNLVLDKLVFEFNPSDNSLSFKGALSENPETDQQKYTEKAKKMQPCQDYDDDDDS